MRINKKEIITTKGSIYINIFQLINKIFNLDKFIVKRDLDEKSN